MVRDPINYFWKIEKWLALGVSLRWEWLALRALKLMVHDRPIYTVHWRIWYMSVFIHVSLYYLLALMYHLLRQSIKENFKETASWCFHFMKLNGLGLRTRTKISQKMPNAQGIWAKYQTIHHNNNGWHVINSIKVQGSDEKYKFFYNLTLSIFWFVIILILYWDHQETSVSNRGV